MSQEPVKTIEDLKRLHGLFLLDKPAGISSFGLLEDLRYHLARELSSPVKKIPKMGHGGTLDPFATGLLVVCFNDGVKLSRYYLDSRKTYLATVKWGETTLSGDFTNEVTERTEKVPSSREEIQAAADRFRSVPYDQVPPMHSAKKVGGETLYKLARQGLEVERLAKRCEIFQLEVLSHDPEARLSVLVCEVSAGTYIRTLAQDLAITLGSLAALTELRRTASGKFSLEGATPMKEALSLRGFIPLDRALPHLTSVPVRSEEAKALREGRQGCLVEVLERAGIPTQTTAPPSGESGEELRDRRGGELGGDHLNDSTTEVTPTRVALYDGAVLLGISTLGETGWSIERIFSRELQ